jgi:prevent-host-death family protein
MATKSGEKKESRIWPVQDAKARFSELLEAHLTKGPQIVTRRGVEMAVLVRVDQWRSLEEATRPRLKDLLLAESPRADIPVPERRARRRREPTALG